MPGEWRNRRLSAWPVAGFENIIEKSKYRGLMTGEHQSLRSNSREACADREVVASIRFRCAARIVAQ